MKAFRSATGESIRRPICSSERLNRVVSAANACHMDANRWRSPMLPIQFTSMPTEVARAYQAGAADANGQVPERHISDGDGVLLRRMCACGRLPQPRLSLTHQIVSMCT